MRECEKCKQCYPDAVMHCPQDGMPTFQSIEGDPILEGKFRLEKRLGQGGMGLVYVARHVFLKSQYAVKVILPDLFGNNPDLITRFRQEALAAAAIRHHNVVSVTDYGVVRDKIPFLVMEYVEGESLNDLLVQRGKLPLNEAIELISAIGSGVAAAHRQGIVHRDLKPLNIMICNDKPSYSESVKILDFGLAKIKSGEILGSFIQAQTTGLMGSPLYMSPEQWADEEPDSQSDLYSLGIMLFQMIAGDVPFKGNSIPAIMKKHMSDPLPTFAEFGVEVPTRVEVAIRHALEKSREKRTQTVPEMISELKTAISDSKQNFDLSQSGENKPAIVHLLTSPPNSKVYIDGEEIGISHDNGWLIIENLKIGNHTLRVSKDGFSDWENQFFFEGKPQQINAQLSHLTQQIPQHGQQTFIDNSSSNVNPMATQISIPNGAPNVGLGMQTGSPVGGNTQPFQSPQPPQPVSSPPQKKRSSSSYLIIAAGMFGLLIVGLGAFLAYQLGWLKTGGGGIENANIVQNANISILNQNSVNSGNVNQSGNNQDAPKLTTEKNEFIDIPAGSFTMGNNGGLDREQPENLVNVSAFAVSKKEISNSEYYEFVKAANHRAPENWRDGKPIAGEENLPVSRVSYDDAKAYASWFSTRNNGEYRLPTEEEWEYLARNGGANNLYPWGDKWEENRAVLGTTAPKPVGSMPSGANKWGVLDLIGNVNEWTSTEFQAYPGGRFTAPSEAKNSLTIRGGSFQLSYSSSKITSTSRFYAQAKNIDPRLGFRLVKVK